MIDNVEEKPRTTAHRECRVCLGEHNDAIHEATLSVHSWFRSYVTRHFVKEDVAEEYVA